MRWLGATALLFTAGCKACLDLPDASYPCDPSDAGQCPSDMSCRLDGFCHTHDGGAYPCTSNDGCDPGWSCGFEGSCMPLGVDDLSAGYTGDFVSTPVSPLLFTGPPGALGVSQEVLFAERGGQVATLRTVALSYDGGAYMVLRFALGGLGVPGEITSYTVAPIDRTLLDPATVLQVAALPGSSWFLTRGGLSAFYVPDAGSADAGLFLPAAKLPILALPGAIPPGADQIRVLGLTDAGATDMVVYSGDGGPFGLVEVPPQVFPPVAFPGPNSLPGSPIDVVKVASCPTTGLLSTREGITYFDDLDGGSGWQVLAVTTGTQADPTPVPTSLGRIRLAGGLLAAEGTAQVPGAQPDVYLFAVDATDCRAIALGNIGLAPCSPCQPGDRLEDFNPGPAVGPPSLEARCSNAVLGEYSVRKTIAIGPTGQGCEPLATASSLFSEESSVAQVGDPSLAGYMGSHGNLWVGSSLAEVSPFLTPDVAADTLVGFSGQQLAYASGEGDYALTAPRIGLLDFAAGAQGGLGMACEIEGIDFGGIDQTGVAFTRSQGNTSIRLATLDSSVASFNGPYHALAVTLPSGTTELVVGTDDTVLAGDITASLAGGAQGALTFRVIPAVRRSIVSMVSAPSPDGVSVVVYVLNQSGLFKVVGNPAVLDWLSTAIAIPPGQPVKLLRNGRNVRIAYSDGTFFSVTSGLQLAGPLPLQPAGDFAQFCGDTYALGPDRMYRLTPGADGGAWADFDATCTGAGCKLTGTLPAGTGDYGFSGGRLRATGSPAGWELEVMTGFGSMARVNTVGTCSPPDAGP